VRGLFLMTDFAADKKVLEQLPVAEVAALAETEKYLQFVDVRRPAEYANGHAVRTVSIPLDRLSREIDQLDPMVPTYVICQSGYRSSLGASILENAGFQKVYNVTGGTSAWVEADLPTEVSSTACAATK